MQSFLSIIKNINAFRESRNFLLRFLTSNTNSSYVHEISFKSCGSIYEKWRETGKYSKLPKSDLLFRIKYLDTAKNSKSFTNNKTPVVLALHGAPGSCNEFSNLAGFFSDKDVRVISPSFPDFSNFRPGIFRHTDEEKAQFVKDFLSAISVSKVDLLVCHSSSIYPGLLLCLSQNPVIKSLAMLNPATHSLKMPAIRFYKILKLVAKASENNLLLKVMEIFGPIVMKMAKVPVRVDQFLDPLLSATVMIGSNITESKEKFLQLTSARFPIFYAFSEDDKLIGGKNAQSLASLLGAEPSDIYFVDKFGTLQRTGNETPNLKVMSFENGSHYVFWKYSHVINTEVYKFLLKRTSADMPK